MQRRPKAGHSPQLIASCLNAWVHTVHKRGRRVSRSDFRKMAELAWESLPSRPIDQTQYRSMLYRYRPLLPRWAWSSAWESFSSYKGARAPSVQQPPQSIASIQGDVQREIARDNGLDPGSVMFALDKLQAEIDKLRESKSHRHINLLSPFAAIARRIGAAGKVILKG
jgi:hypothetical protein